MLKDLAVREAVPADAEKLLEFTRIVGGESDNLTFGAEGLPVTVEQERAYLETVRQDLRHVFLTVWSGEELIATADLFSSARERLKQYGRIAVSVRKAYWGQGVGSRLMEELLKYAEVMGVRYLSLEVRSDNEAAKALYRKYGFEKTGVYPGYLCIDGVDRDCDLMIRKT